MNTIKIQQKINPFLWFDNNAEEAVNFYLSVFKNAKITSKTYYANAGPGKEGAVMTVAFTLDGVDFIALNGGPNYKFTEAVSFVINCKNQEEIDYYWDKLTQNGKEAECGWLKDKFGLSWQVVPVAFFEMISDSDNKKVERVMKAMMTMKKFELARLEEAYNANS